MRMIKQNSPYLITTSVLFPLFSLSSKMKQGKTWLGCLECLECLLLQRSPSLSHPIRYLRNDRHLPSSSLHSSSDSPRDLSIPLFCDGLEDNPPSADHPDLSDGDLALDEFSPCHLLFPNGVTTGDDPFPLHSLLGRPFGDCDSMNPGSPLSALESTYPNRDPLFPLDDCKVLPSSSLLSQITSLYNTTVTYHSKRRHTTCGDLCRSLMNAPNRRSRNQSLHDSGLPTQLLPIRYDIAFGDVFPCEVDDECCFIYSKRRADSMKTGIM